MQAILDRLQESSRRHERATAKNHQELVLSSFIEIKRIRIEALDLMNAALDETPA